jgi:ribonuclease P protein component
MKSTSNFARRQTLAGSRLRKHADYLRAYARGRKQQSVNMSWFLAPQSEEPASTANSGRVGLTVSKLLGKAHQRNRIKRRMREALRRHIDLLPEGFDLIFHPRRSVLTVEFTELEAEIVRILEIAGRDAVSAAKRAATTSVARMIPAP